MRDLLKALRDEFVSLPVETQRDILLHYADYVADYPDYRADIECYPACFWEWYDNDYKEAI